MKTSFVYFGSSHFSKHTLQGLLTYNCRPSLIVTQPDKPRGRGLKESETEISLFAKAQGITCLKPLSLKDAQFQEKLKAQQADFFIVADYGQHIPSKVLELPDFFTLCLHPSLLPQYRGAAPIEYVLLSGAERTGVTVFKVNERIDAGDIIMQKPVSISACDDYCSLSEKLSKVGADVLVQALKAITSGHYALKPQDESKATITHKLTKADGRLLWQQSADEICNRIRATLGWPSAFTYYKGESVQILNAKVIAGSVDVPAGTVIKVAKEGIDVAAGKNKVRITFLKPQGKKEMSAWAFVCGRHLAPGEKFFSEPR